MQYHCFFAHLRAQECIFPILARDPKRHPGKNGGLAFTNIHEQKSPLPLYCGNGDYPSISSAAQTNASPTDHSHEPPDVPSRKDTRTLLSDVLNGHISRQMSSLHANFIRHSSQHVGVGVCVDSCAPIHEFNVQNSSTAEYRCHNFPEDRHVLNFWLKQKLDVLVLSNLRNKLVLSCLITCHYGFPKFFL